ncbi:ComEC/Rec2-related protein [Saccharomonospora marina XMU15]|uniref:ComEC/Rec2-related protein n=1 Tax=Saccharomonospora marina XMU15 TaxID=882083 RepID=H5X4F5_9PSEU|nr:ComEC/Rec2 family competence protein [Saccharomonospora marina]EHR49957.1 ComEC/Rec2-related protein [Saccharomonospora marina XMU15]
MNSLPAVGTQAATAPPVHDPRLVPAAIVVWVSTLVGLLWTWWVAAVCGVLAAVCGCVLAWRLTRHRIGLHRWLGAAGALFVCGLLTAGPTSARLYASEHDPLREAARRGPHAQLRVTLAERPRPLRSPGYADRPGGARSVLIPADVETAAVSGRPVASTGRVLLIAPAKGWSSALPGQRATLGGTLAPARPGELTTAVVHVRGPPRHSTTAAWWQRGAESVRAALRSASQVLQPEPAGLLPGLVVGDTSGLPGIVEEEFLSAGLSHLTAVSGTNVAIVCGAVLLLARWCRLGPFTSAGGAAIALVGYVVLVGYEPSVLRAGFMGAVGLLALVLGRQRSALPALGAAVCVLVLYDPGLATSMGFALSVVATAGLVLVAPRWASALCRRGVPVGLAQGIAVPVAAFLVTAPVIAGMAGEVSVVSVAANVVAAPVVAPVTVLGVLAAVLAPMWSPGAELLVHMAGPGVSWLISVARRAAAIPGAVLPWPPGWWGGVLALGVVVLLAVALRHRGARTALVVLVVGLLLVIPARLVVSPWPPHDWVLVACDVGQGDGIVLATGEQDRALVVDTGPEPGSMDRCLDRLGVERVPLVVLSHLHADHVGGLAAVFDGRSVGAIAVGPGRTPDWAWRDVTERASAHGTRVVRLHIGDRLSWPSLRLDVMGPRYVPSEQGDDGTEVNNSSVVLRATTTAGRVLLTGDVELAAQADLLASGADLRAEVLKIPHHGSRYSLPPFLSAVAPRIALVSVGADNGYGHPNPGTLRGASSRGALVARTDTGGDTAIVGSDGQPAVVRRGRSP